MIEDPKPKKSLLDLTPIHTISFEELKSRASAGENFVSLQGYPVHTRDCKWNESRALELWMGDVSHMSKQKPIIADRPVLNKKDRPFTWSPSAINDFITCPAQYAAKRFYFTVPYEESEAMRQGTIEHKHLEDRLASKTPLPAGYTRGEKFCAALEGATANNGELIAEREMAITSDFKLTGWFDKNAWGRCKIDVTAIVGNKLTVLDWKGLALNTQIPTPDGWKTVETIATGDQLFAGDGSICKVVGKSPVFHRKCYKLKFKDGAEIVCDDQHLWPTNICTVPGSFDVRSAEEIYDLVSKGSGVSMPVAKAPQYAAKDLLIHPYVLGCWLGDGKHTAGEITKSNEALFSAISDCGYEVGPDISSDGKCQARTVYKLRGQLRKLGLLENKHIPTEYLQGDTSQRLALLQGLYDTDGSWNFTRKQAIFTTANRDFAAQVTELISSLGQKPYSIALTKHGFGKTIQAFDIIFTPNELNPFKAHRKAAEVPQVRAPHVMSHRRYIKTIEEIPSEPTQCIAVDSPDHTYLCTDRYITTHNTGKKKNDLLQLKINACFLSLAYPNVEVFNTKFVWLRDGEMTPKAPEGVFTKDQIPELWDEILEHTTRMQRAWECEEFHARQGGLCRSWCPVTECIHCGGRK
jgi:hypothetical protein